MSPNNYDAAGVEKAIHDLLVAVGEDPERPGLKETPARMGRAFAQIFAGLHSDPRQHLHKTFPVDHSELVLVKDIPMYSMCEHHLLPFFGVAHVGYIPSGGAVTGLSKLARLVDGYARRPQVQENLTAQIADALVTELKPTGVIVVLQAEHMCMTMRGVRKPGSKTTTSTVRGVMEKNPATRAEAMSLILN